jgi:hypothetical protein
MSLGLQREFAGASYATWLAKVPCFDERLLQYSGPDRPQDMHENFGKFIAAIALRLQVKCFPITERFIEYGEEAHEMFIIRNGQASARGMVFQENDCVGQDMLYGVKRRSYSANAMTFLKLVSLHRSDLVDVFDEGGSHFLSLHQTFIDTRVGCV